MKILKNLLTKLLLKIGLKYKKRSFHEAVEAAEKLNRKTNQKCLIFLVKGEFKVVTKQTIRECKQQGMFKGLDYADIEKRALYVVPNYLRPL